MGVRRTRQEDKSPGFCRVRPALPRRNRIINKKEARVSSGPFFLECGMPYAQPWFFTKLVMTGTFTYLPPYAWMPQ
jgi:hypothetical protein